MVYIFCWQFIPSYGNGNVKRDEIRPLGMGMGTERKTESWALGFGFSYFAYYQQAPDDNEPYQVNIDFYYFRKKVVEIQFSKGMNEFRMSSFIFKLL